MATPEPPPLPPEAEATDPATLAPSNSVPATPVESPPQAYVPDPDLQALIETVIGDEQASYGVYVKNLADGTGASINPNRAYRSASLFKVYVMWEAFRQESLGIIDLDGTMAVTPYYKSFELGTNAVDVGDVVSVRTALSLMMSISDTPTAVLLQDTLGFENVNAALQALGIYDSGLFYPGDPLATARDIAVLLEAIARGAILPDAAHETMLALLLSEQTDNGLRAGVPASVSVGHNRRNGASPVQLRKRCGPQSAS